MVDKSAKAPVATERLKEYWSHGEGAAKIGWGTPGDYYRCLAELGKYLRPDEVHGYCQEMHIRALGYATATHAKMLRGGK